jgi:nucleotide-binding universal stress UspA family protein
MRLAGGSTVLVPVDVSTADPLDEGILEHLRPVDVVVLGHYPVPRQTAPAHLRADHEAEARARLEAAVARVDAADHEVEGVLVFTRDRRDSIDRVADEHGCDAVLVPGETSPVERILVPLRGTTNLERIVSLVADLERTSAASITLFHSVADGTDPDGGAAVLRDAVERLVAAGVDRDRLRRDLSETGDARAEIVARAREHDLVILGETEPSLRARIIGATLTPILDAIDAPAIVVRDAA